MATGRNEVSRRSFLRTTGVAALAVPNIITSKALGSADGTPPASERIVLASVGAGGQGSSDLGNFMRDKRVQLVAVCDVRKQVRETWAAKGKDIKTYIDYREMIQRSDIDMIHCATPDHNHAQVTIDSMKAGKDIFCQKPLGLTIGEGRKMVETARQYSRVFSCGSQRVMEYAQEACAANSGRYGKILEAWSMPGDSSRMCTLPAQGDPEADGIDWDLWLGAAPWAPYHPQRCSGGVGMNEGFRAWVDYSGGMTTDLGAHRWGGVLHAFGLEHTGPTDIILPGHQGCDNLTLVFANGMRIVSLGTSDGRAMKPRYLCEGGLAVPYVGMPTPPPGLRWYEDGARSPQEDVINCIIKRRRPFRDVEVAHRTATCCHLTNIARLLNRDLKWDPDTERFINDEAANRMISRPRRGPWQI